MNVINAYLYTAGYKKARSMMKRHTWIYTTFTQMYMYQSLVGELGCKYKLALASGQGPPLQTHWQKKNEQGK